MKATEQWSLQESVRFGASAGASSGNNAAARGIKYHQKLYKTLKLHVLVSCPGMKLYVEPWFKGLTTRKLRSPDAVLVDPDNGRALVIEAKMNWSDGRDVKLIDEYLPIVASAFALATRPLLITGNVRGLKHEPLVGLSKIMTAWDWKPGQPTPVALVL